MAEYQESGKGYGQLYLEGHLPEAIAIASRLLAQRPDDYIVRKQLGQMLLSVRQFSQAEQLFAECLRRKVGDAEVYILLGVCYQRQGRFDEASHSYDRALALAPDHPKAHRNRAELRLLEGDLSGGFPEFRWRLESEMYRHWYPEYCRLLSGVGATVWEGGLFSGKRILVCGEGGQGDHLMFSRYLPQIKARGGQVMLLTRKSLERVMARVAGADQIFGDISLRELEAIRPDYYVFLLNLPAIFGSTLRTLPVASSYMRRDPAGELSWQRRIAGAGLRVGLVWAGSGYGLDADVNSCGLAFFQSLFALPGVSFYSLQVGAAANELKHVPAVGIADLAPHLGDFADTADAMSCLDLIITVDTSVAHLAGALGKKTWVLLPAVPAWHWQLNRTDSPWYPSLRLFRQPAAGDWPAVIAAIRSELQALVATAPAARFPG